VNNFEFATEANRGYEREKIHYVNSAGYFKEFDPTIIRKIDRPFCQDVYINEIENDNYIFKLRNPLKLTIEKGIEMFTIYNDEFDLSGIGFSREEAFEDFSDFFVHDYFSFSNSPVEELSVESLQLLEQYKLIIEEILDE